MRRALRGPCAPPRPRDARAPGAPRRPARLLVAVSGGADSTALLVALRRLAPELRLRLHAAHLHHGLRGAEADADLRFVRALCARLRVPLDAARWDARARLRRRGLAGQDGLRVLRREFLTGAARRAGATAVVTAHTADDQLETLLMRLGRGTGLTGLGGMRPARRRSDGHGGHVLWLKPLLGATRAMIEADLRAAAPARPGGAAGPPWREDRSNLDPRYTRGRVRHEAVPALGRALLPHADPARARELLARRAARATASARGAGRALDRLAGEVLRAALHAERDGATLRTGPLAGLPRSLRRAVLAGAWRRTGARRRSADATGLTDAHLRALERLIDTGRGGAIIQLPGGWTAERDRRTVRFRRAAAAGAGSGPAAARLRPPGRLDWDGERLVARWTTGTVARRSLRAGPGPGEYFAAEGIRAPLVVRRARSDEWFVPFGRARAARLGRFLNKQGVPTQLRRHPTVLADAGGILWVVGVRRSSRAPVTAATRRALRVHAERHD